MSKAISAIFEFLSNLESQTVVIIMSLSLVGWVVYLLFQITMSLINR